MSMYGSLGSKAKCLRDAFVSRLTSFTEVGNTKKHLAFQDKLIRSSFVLYKLILKII